MDHWLKVFFTLFLKYKPIFTLPRVSGKMVEMSNELKCFRNMITDSSASALYAVSILTKKVKGLTVESMVVQNGMLTAVVRNVAESRDTAASRA